MSGSLLFARAPDEARGRASTSRARWLRRLMSVVLRRLMSVVLRTMMSVVLRRMMNVVLRTTLAPLALSPVIVACGTDTGGTGGAGVELAPDAALPNDDGGGLSASSDAAGSDSTDASASPSVADAGDVAVALDAGDTVPVPASSPDGAVALGPLPHDGERQSICYDDSDCKGNELGCYAPNSEFPGICVDSCSEDSECPQVEGITQGCSTLGQCRVDCTGTGSGDGPCPSQEICRDTRSTVLGPSIWRCTFPPGSGRKDVPTYGACSTDHENGDCQGTQVCHVPTVTLGFPTGLSSTAGYCSHGCATAHDCAVPTGTTAVPLCESAVCEFDCGAAGGNVCPNPAMNCRDIDESPLVSVYRCRYIDG